MLVATAALAVASCSKWTEPERKTFPGQGNIERIIPEPPAKPLIEIKTEAELNNTQREYFKQIREYRTTPHVLGFGWYGNWTGQGTDPMRHLKTLPDSVDFVSLWGTHGNLTEAQKTDLKLFREVKGGKVLLCWIVQNLGDQLTPQGKNATDYWVTEKGGGDFLEGVKAYANAICDTIEKYDLDGFDLDYEPGYGHSGNMATTTAWISETGNVNMYTFIKTLYDRLNPKGRIVVMDGEPYYMNRATSKMVSYYIYQAYDESTTSAALNKVRQGSNLDNWEGKTFLTLEFQKYSKTGGFPRYTSSNPEIQKLDAGRQIMDYATMLMPNGKRIAGIGTYHMELDTEGGSYRFLRQALNAGNRVSDTQKADFQ